MNTGTAGQPSRRVICDRCGARAWFTPDEDRPCADCGGAFRDMGALEGLVDRWFAPPDHRVSEFYPRHLKLIELMWTTGGKGREMYEALGLEKVSYTQFVTRGTQVVVKGLAEGWIQAVIPPAPTHEDEQYSIRFLDPERWADTLVAAFEHPRLVAAQADQVRVDVEGDPDVA